MNKQWVLNSTIATYAISLIMFVVMHSNINYKSKNNLGNYENLVTINDTKILNTSYDSNVIDNKPSNIFYFIQISDIHISEIDKNGRFSHLKYFVENVLPVISPRFVFVTGDIVDSAPVNNQQSKQKEREWKSYQNLLDQNEFLQKHNESFWFDIRGNHDSFNTPNFDHESNLYKIYSKTKTPNFNINYVTNYGSYIFHSIDGTPRHSPSSPYDLFGIVDRERVDEIAAIYNFAKSNNHKHIFSFCHYPRNTINMAKSSDGRSWSELSKQTSLFMSGHLHDLYAGLKLYAHHRHFLELEIMDFKLHAVYRIVSVDHDVINFVDNVLPMPSIPYQNDKSLEELLEQPKYNFTTSVKPVVLITNPQDTQTILPKDHYPKIEPKKLTHVRTLIFSHVSIKSIELYIDDEKISTIDSLENQNSSFKLIGNADQNSNDYLPLYAMEWAGNESYHDGKTHIMTIKAYDSNNEVGESTIHFNFDNKQEAFRIDLFSRNALRFYLTTLVPLTSIGLIMLYHIILGVIPFLHIHNRSIYTEQYNHVEQYELGSISESNSSCSISNSSSSNFSSNSNNNSIIMNKSRNRGLFYRICVQPFIDFASNPYLFYPYHFIYIYYLIGPQIFGSLSSSGNTFKEKFVIAFLHGVYANGEIINLNDGYFYMLKDLIKSHLILLLLIVYLNHCRCRQFIITILVHLYLIYYCIRARYRTYISYQPYQLFLSPFYSWFMIYEVLTILFFLIHNFIKYPSNYRKFFKNQ